MLIEELRELVDTVRNLRAEMQHVEVKAAHQGCPKRLYDTLSSFSNQEGGGTILFGLDEKAGFAVVGVYDAQDLQQKINEQCKQMSPIVRPLFTVAEVDGRYVVSAEIPEIDVMEKPCFYAGAGRLRGSYIRVGEADELMTEYEVYSFEAFRRRHQDDVRVVERATIDMLDQSAIDNYLQTVLARRPNLARLDAEQIREVLSITHKGAPTLAAVLLFSPYPQAYFPQFSVTAVVVPGYQMGETDEEGARFVDNKRIEGNIVQMLDESLSFAQRNMAVKTIVDEQSGKRKDRTEYPIKALREAILNALVHRDYSFYSEGTPVQIIFYKDRLEIHNPGGLYGRMTIDQLGRANADTRNPVLANMLEAMGVVENRYSGIPTIQRELRNAGLPAPEFRDSRGQFSVTFHNGKTEQVISGERNEPTVEEKLLAFCVVPRTRKEIAEMLGLTTNYYVMQNYVLPLVERGLLRMTMPDKPRSRYQQFVSTRA